VAVLSVSFKVKWCSCNANDADNTNRDRKTRKLYVDLANKLNVPIRLVPRRRLRIRV
jgi:hypothetical protein